MCHIYEFPATIENLPDDVLLEIFSNIDITEQYKTIRFVSSKWFWLVSKIVRNVKGLCLGDNRRVQVFFHKEPKYSTSFTSIPSKSPPPFFQSNVPHRVAPGGNVAIEFCWSYLQEWTPSSSHPNKATPHFLLLNCTEPFLAFLIRNASDRLQYLHVAVSQLNDAKTHNFLLFILLHVFTYCTKLKSLQCGTKFLHIASQYMHLKRGRTYTDMLLDKVSRLEEFILIDEENQPMNVPYMFLETLMLKCNRIRRLVFENIQVNNDIVLNRIAKMRLERLDFRIRGNQTYAPILFHCFESGFGTLKEVKLSVPLRQSYTCIFQISMEYLRTAIQLEKFSIGYQLGDQMCIHGGEVACALRKGFANLKYLELCSLKFAELTDPAFTCNGMFLQNVASTLQYLRIGQLNYELFLTILSANCCGDLTRTTGRPMIKLRHLKIECRSIMAHCCLVDFIDRFCPNLEYVEFFDYDYTYFVCFARKMRDRVHNDKKCDHRKLEGQCSRRIMMMTPGSLSEDTPEQIASFEPECCLTMYHDHQQDMYVAIINRCCSLFY
uniref:F-box domain-containing protein n=1 Tax=Romanomermis culicivorax TaxID=13658 RepID=A0A915L6N2_ROMCU